MLGGDECHTECWAANPAIAAWAAAQNLTTDGAGEGSAFGWWVDQIVSVLQEQGKTPMMWTPLEWNPANPPAALTRARATLLLWTGNLTALARNITITGQNDLVAAPAPWWYLDGGNSIHDAYSHAVFDLCPGCSAPQKAMIVGGEACMWGTNTDVTNIFGTVWPRLTAVAERLWSAEDAQYDLLDNSMRRARLARCRLLARGLPVPPLGGEVYDPDASHRSFSAAREWQWCQGDDQSFDAHLDMQTEP